MTRYVAVGLGVGLTVVDVGDGAGEVVAVVGEVVREVVGVVGVGVAGGIVELGLPPDVEVG